MTDRPYSYARCSSSPEIDYPTWRIYKQSKHGKFFTHLPEDIVWHCRDDDDYAANPEAPYPPQRVRDEYERLLREAGWTGPDTSVDIGRVFNTGLYDAEFDQPCRWGQNCDGYAVYCTNDAWLYGPRKCHRNRDDWKHEDCEGFAPNHAYKAEGG
jgi:hypothetical protein